MAISWLGGRVSFYNRSSPIITTQPPPLPPKKRQGGTTRKSFSNKDIKDMIDIYLLSTLAGKWMSAKLLESRF